MISSLCKDLNIIENALSLRKFAFFSLDPVEIALLLKSVGEVEVQYTLYPSGTLMV